MDTAFSTHKKLFRTLIVVSLLAALLVLTFTSWGTYTLYRQHIINDARQDALNLGRTIVDFKNSAIFNQLALDQAQAIRNPEQLQTLDTALETFLSPYNILKIKVFSTQGLLIYSTDHSLIGKNSQGNKELAAALEGQANSIIRTRGSFRDLSHETRFDVDVAETYIPIYNDKREIVGAFELYQDMTTENNEAAQIIWLSSGALAITILIVYLVAFYIIRLSSLQLVAAQKMLETLATTDPGTQLFNRREILRLTNDEIHNLSQQKNQLSTPIWLTMMMIDLDHFKQINDRYGHPVGDLVLKQVSERITHTLRPDSHLGRYGGEEFIAILKATSPMEAHKIAERLLKQISRDPIALDNNQQISITMSIGVISTKDTSTNFDQLLMQVDHNLYQAKAEGRNCYVASLYQPTHSIGS